MATAIPARGRVIAREQPGTRNARFDWAVLVVSAWLVGGMYLDGWAHNNFDDLDTFFTVWHAVLYSGYAAAAILFGEVALRNRAQGLPWRRALPAG